VVATGHIAIVTGANHGIGAATAQALAARGGAVLCTFLRVRDPPDPGTPQAYRDHRAHDAAAVIARIRDDGGMAAAVEAGMSDPAAPALLFDAAEEQFGPVDILVNNAAELGEDLAQVILDGAGGDEQPAGDLRVGQSVAGQPGDLGILAVSPLSRMAAVRGRAVWPVARNLRRARSANELLGA
jgi:3-oxoacyl-[acyl-carrier protein] reductase